MMSGRGVHRTGTLALSGMMVALGVALIVQALSAGTFSARLLLGVLFLAGGGGRIFVERRRGSG
jgi:hypothetical protein